MSELADRKCEPCSAGTPPLRRDQIERLRASLQPGWEVVDQHHLERVFRFPDFRQALAFTNRVGELAEEEQHHPDLHLGWGRVKVLLFTHKIDGLSDNDFILASKIDRLG
jgi:4a-hydroxytetrahydrobiopterin dehydratase